MTNWIPDVVPDALIESAWGNKIRDRTVTPFANAAERDASIPTPKVGMACWLTDQNVLQLYAGGAWRVIGGSGATTRYAGTVVAGSITTTLTAISSALIVPNLTYPHRLFVTASIVFSTITNAGAVVELRAQYDLTGASPAAGASSLRTVRGAAALAGSTFTPVAVGYLDRATGGTTGLILRALVSSGTATLAASADISGFDVIAQPM